MSRIPTRAYSPPSPYGIHPDGPVNPPSASIHEVATVVDTGYSHSAQPASVADTQGNVSSARSSLSIEPDVENVDGNRGGNRSGSGPGSGGAADEREPAGSLPLAHPPLPDAEPVDPPPYSEDLKVEPMTSEQTSRYDRGPLPIKSLPRHMAIPMALYTLSPPPMVPVPPGWIEFIHPEGQKYYYQPVRRIITDSNIKEPRVLEVVYRAMAQLELRLNAQNLILPPTTEVTLEVDIEQAPPVVKYYYVDHGHKTQFWLEATNTEKLKLPPVTSYSHLKLLFRQHYWTHIEFYPMHLTLSMEVEEELIAVLTHACVDYMTSSLSTVPYNQEQCEAYLRLIRNIPDSDRAEGYRNCVLARLWSEIDGNFFVNLRGEENPRLSRIQRLLPEPNVQTPGMVGWVKGWMMLGTSEWYERILGEMWVDKVSYASHWRKFMGGMVSEWKMHAVWTFVLMIVASITFGLSMTSQTIRQGWSAVFLQSSGLASLIISLIGLGTSFVLVRMHRTQTEASASEAGDYLDKYFHKSLGLQPLSILYALPQASALWAFAFLATSILTFGLTLDAIFARILVGGGVIFIAAAIWFVVMCVDGREDGTGSLVREGMQSVRGSLNNARDEVPRRMRDGMGRAIRSTRSAARRIRVRTHRNGARPRAVGDTENGVDGNDNDSVEDNDVQTNGGGSAASSPRSHIFVQGPITSTAPISLSTSVTNAARTLRSALGFSNSDRDAYQPLQTHESPLAAMFRNPREQSSNAGSSNQPRERSYGYSRQEADVPQRQPSNPIPIPTPIPFPSLGRVSHESNRGQRTNESAILRNMNANGSGNETAGNGFTRYSGPPSPPYYSASPQPGHTTSRPAHYIQYGTSSSIASSGQDSNPYTRGYQSPTGDVNIRGYHNSSQDLRSGSSLGSRERAP